jgi:hypothetical protein
MEKKTEAQVLAIGLRKQGESIKVVPTGVNINDGIVMMSLISW